MRFTLITEGASENRIIKQIIIKYFKEHEIFFRDAQPQIIKDKQMNGGGWLEVLKYCERKDDISEIFNETDYLIIQIDTDVSPIKNFGVSHYKEDNTLKTCQELHLDVTNKLYSLIDATLLQKYKTKILLAICIHSTECWLLPLLFNNKQRETNSKCIDLLNKELAKQDLYTIPKDKNGTKAIRAYDEILRKWRKPQDIIDSAAFNCGFQKFVDSLATIPI